MRPKSQCVKVAALFPNQPLHSCLHLVEATVKRLVSARLDQVYAGPTLTRMRGKGKSQALVSSPMGLKKAENAVINFAADSDLARRKQQQQLKRGQ
jgi:hypothetical protein